MWITPHEGSNPSLCAKRSLNLTTAVWFRFLFCLRGLKGNRCRADFRWTSATEEDRARSSRENRIPPSAPRRKALRMLGFPVFSRLFHVFKMCKLVQTCAILCNLFRSNFGQNLCRGFRGCFLGNIVYKFRTLSDKFLWYNIIIKKSAATQTNTARWSSQAARRSHNPKVACSSHALATTRLYHLPPFLIRKRYVKATRRKQGHARRWCAGKACKS